MNRLFLLILFWLLCTPFAWGQQGNVDLNRRIQLTSYSLRLDSLLNELSRKSGVQFSFNSRRISQTRTIKLNGKNQTLQQILNQLNNLIGIKYRVVGDHVILVDDPEKKLPIKQANPSSNIPVSGDSERKSADLQPVKPLSITGAAVNRAKLIDVKADSTIVKDTVKVNQNSDTSQKIIPRDSIRLSSPLVTNDTSTRISQVPDSLIVSALPKETISSNSSFLRNTSIEISPRGIGVNYVGRISNSIAIEIATGVGAGYLVTGKTFYYKMQPGNPAYYISITPKYFIGRQESAPFYLGLQVKYNSPQLRSRDGQTIDTSAKWISGKGYTNAAIFFDLHGGYQKQFGDRWRLNTHLGLGYSFAMQSKGLNHWYPAIGLRMSYRLEK